MTKRKIPSDIIPLILIILGVVGVTIVSRLVTYLILVKKSLPFWLFAQIGGYRLHHFVYGNILILVTGFFAIGLGTKKYHYLFAALYGIGVGLVLDEFLPWVGDVKQLSNNVLFIPDSLKAVFVAFIVTATIIAYRLHKDHHA
jgi:hypothetical protein